MPISQVLVEGNLDTEILTAVFGGDPVVVKGGSKNGLKPQAQRMWERTRTPVVYLRHRDFDYDPPNDPGSPVVDSTDKASAVAKGWHWSRHEIENCLLDPSLVSVATGRQRQEVERTIVASAARILVYEQARWVIGATRRTLPPLYRLSTRPTRLSSADLGIPQEGEDELRDPSWAGEQIQRFLGVVDERMNESAVAVLMRAYQRQLESALESGCSAVLHWFSGKDPIVPHAAWQHPIR